MKKEFIDILKNRRSLYALSKESTISDDEIVDLVKDALLHTPSAFNSQSGRAVVLFGKEHDVLWDIVTEELRKLVPADRFSPTLEKMKMFKTSHGTILFFEDQDVIKDLQTRFPKYKDVFPVWSYEGAGMLNFTIWTALAEKGLGASLQHYNPIIDEAVAKHFRLPLSWKLIAQMPFGVPVAKPEAKTFLPVEGRIKVFGK